MTASRWKKSWTTFTLVCCCAALVLAMAPYAARAGAFTPGNIVVERLGDGTQAVVNTGDTIFFDEYTTTGGVGQTPVNSIQIPMSGTSALIDDGTASTGGAITLSPDGELLCFPGYATNEPSSESLSTTTSTAVPRGVGTLNASGVYLLAATTTTEYSTTTIRGATTDDQGNFWTSGGSLSGVGGGLNYVGTNNPAANLTDGTFRHIYLFGTNLWFDVQNSSGSGGDNLGVYEFNGAPMTAATPAKIFTLTGSSTYGLSINNPANPTVIYFADATLSGIHKWINNNGVWSQAYILFSNNVFGLTVDWSTIPATLYATTTGVGNKLVRIVDNGPTSVAITNATAKANQILRGVAFAPIAIAAGSSSAANVVNLTCTTVAGGGYNWSGPNGFSSSLQNPVLTNVTVAAAGTYTVAVTVGGTYTVTATTTPVLYPNTNITTPANVCPDSLGNLASVPDAGAGATYVWTITGGSITAGAATDAITYTASASGTITLGCTITNSAGNGGAAVTTVNISVIPTTTARNTGPYCSGSTLQLSATGAAGDVYQWTGPAGFTSTLQNPTLANATTANDGVYGVTRDTGCGISLAATTTVTVNPIPEATITAAASVCGNSTGNPASVPDAGAGAAYAWTISGGTIAAGSTNAAILYTANASGTVLLGCTVTNGSGCTSSAGSATVAINPLPDATITTARLVLTNSINNTASVPAGSGYSYEWTIAGGTITGGAQGNFITFTAGGRGTTLMLGCTVTPTTGCSARGNATVAVYQPFTPGNLAILRISDGTQLLSATGNSVFIDEYATDGTWVQSIPLPDSGTNAIVEAPTSTVEGNLTLSADGTRLAFPGYLVAYTNSTSSVAETSASTVPRVACTLDSGVNFEVAAVTTDQYSGDNLRGIASDGTNNFWTAGSSDGTWYLNPDSETTVQINQASNTRQVGIFNGNLYIVTASSLSEWGPGIYEFTGLPDYETIPTPVILSTNATPPGANPFGFSFSPDGWSAYLADQLAGLSRWTNSGGNWTQAYNFPALTTELSGLMVDWSGTNPVLYATSTNATGTATLISMVDTGGGSAFSTLATGPANVQWRGVTFTPQSWLSQTQPPVITEQPVSQNVLAGQNAAFQVTATGSGLNFQWRFNQSTQGIASASELGLSRVSPTNAGPYSVVVTNSYGSVTSSIVTLTVSLPPTLAVGSTAPENIQLRASTITNLTYVVQTTTNLLNPVWTDVLTNNTGLSGGLNFQTNTAASGSQFYRLVFP